MKFYCPSCAEVVDRPWPKADEPAYTCETCGSRLTRPPKPRKPGEPRRRVISEASDAQREVARLADSCAACRRRRTRSIVLDPAHLAKRSQGGCDDLLCTPFALCRNVFDGSGCHRLFDDSALDLLKLVNAQPDRYREALQHALEHLNCVELVERLSGARTQWSEAAA